MSKIAASILGIFVPGIAAGACVPEHGCCCNPAGAANKGAVDCFGSCKKASSCRKGCSFGI